MTRQRRAGLVLTAVAGWTVVASLWSGGEAAARERVQLPTEEDILAIALGAETILYGPRGIETLLPGPVEDEEVVTVGVGPDGAPAAVRVRQRLVVHGLGDFRFKVSGPAQTVEALPGSEAQPGLRKGAVLWQGFSAERKVLSSEMVMFPDQEAIRLPLRVSYEQTVDGRAAAAPVSGAFSAQITIENRSATPVTITSAQGDPPKVARALDAIARRLAAGRRPQPGSHGVPESLVARGPTRGLTREIPATFAISGRLTFEGGRLDDAIADGGRVAGPAAAPPVVRFRGVVGAGSSARMDVSVDGLARELGRPVLEVVARPAPPPADEARPPGGGRWADLVADGSAPDTRSMWNRIMEICWKVAKLRQYDAYLGNPDPRGPAETEYRFRLAPAGAARGPQVDLVPGAATTPLIAVTALLALFLLLFDGVLLWSLL